jgi:predicted DNA-binding transcriptional regulator AlpA
VSKAELPISDRLLDRDDLGELLGMSGPAISVALSRNKFPIKPIRIGRRLRFRLSDVNAFIANGSTASESAAR